MINCEFCKVTVVDGIMHEKCMNPKMKKNKSYQR